MWAKTRYFPNVRLLGYRFESTTNSGTPKEILDKIIRVDHAGELGADRIYAGQMAVLGIFSYLRYF